MNLNVSQIQEITCGAVKVYEQEGVCFQRFTDTQMESYLERNPQTKQIYSTAGIKLLFETNSSFLELKISAEQATCKSYFSVDVFENGRNIGCLDNFNTDEVPDDYNEQTYNQGEFEKKFELKDGVKQIAIYLPWSSKVTIKEFLVEDYSYIKPLKPRYKMLVLGDSITIGENVARPSNRYAAKIAEMLDAEECCKAIGGEQFCPFLIALPEEVNVDFIWVAYGTNDWAWGTKEEFLEKCSQFFENLSRCYPSATVFVMTPIWRADYLSKDSFCKFEEMDRMIRNIVSSYQKVQVFSGFNRIPHDISYFSDFRLHPNDKGNIKIFENLKKEFIL